MRFDDIFDQIGEFGCYQWRLLIYGAIVAFTSVEVVIESFSSVKMDHWCYRPELKGVINDTMFLYLSIPYANNSTTTEYSKCTYYDYNYFSFTASEIKNWNRSLMLERYDPKINQCDKGWDYNRTEHQETSVSRFNLVCQDDDGTLKTMAAMIVGLVIGAILSGLISDNRGRTSAYMVFISLKVIGCLYSYISRNLVMFIFAKLLVSMGNSGIYHVTFILILEMTGIRNRIFAAVIFAMSFSIGNVAVSIFGYTFRNDNYIHVAILMPNIALACISLTFFLNMLKKIYLRSLILRKLDFGIFFFLAEFIDESPRWLIMKSRFYAAEFIIKKVAAVNHKTCYIMPNLVKMTKGDSSTRSNSNIKDINKLSYYDIFKVLNYQKTRKLYSILLVIWCYTGFAYYSVHVNSDYISKSVYINQMMMYIAEVPGNVLALFSANYPPMGRRYTLSLGCITSSLTTGVFISSLNMNNMNVRLVCLLICKFLLAFTYTILYLVTVELTPTRIRNTSFGFLSVLSKIPFIFLPLVYKKYFELRIEISVIIYTSLGIVAMCMSLMLPETINEPLMDTFDEINVFNGNTWREFWYSKTPFPEKTKSVSTTSVVRYPSYTSQKPPPGILKMLKEKDIKSLKKPSSEVVLVDKSSASNESAPYAYPTSTDYTAIKD